MDLEAFYVSGVVFCFGSLIWRAYILEEKISRISMVGIVLISFVPFLNSVLGLISFLSAASSLGLSYKLERWLSKPAVDFTRNRR